MLDASQEKAEKARDERREDRDSSSEEGWGENEVAPGQQLSDYRSSHQPLPDIQIASGIAAAGSGEREWLIVSANLSKLLACACGVYIYMYADTTPVAGAVVKHCSKDVRGINLCKHCSWVRVEFSNFQLLLIVKLSGVVFRTWVTHAT